MALRLEDKKAIVSEVEQIASRSLAAIAADYRGLTVSELTDLRSKARQAGLYARVVPNTLARRAVQSTDFACLQEALVGPILLLFTSSDPGVAARLVKDFVKGHEKFQVKALALEGKLLAAEQLDAVAKLPTREQAISLLMSVMKAPITQCVRTLAEPCAKFVRTVAAVADKKQAA